MKEGGINFDLWRHYRDCGCYAVKIGVEGVQEAMDATNKRLSEEVVREYVAFMKGLGISVYASFMVGVPGTGPETDTATVKFADELAADRSHLFEYFISSCSVHTDFSVRGRCGTECLVAGWPRRSGTDDRGR